MAYLGLYALQHRGQESAGIVASDGDRVHSEVGMGLVADVFTQERIGRLRGRIAIGHNRYSTAGQSDIKNAQPFLVNCAKGTLALGHNGNLVNSAALRAELEATGSIFRSTTDSEVILHLIARSEEKNRRGRHPGGRPAAGGRLHARHDEGRRADRGSGPSRLPSPRSGQAPLRPARGRFLGSRERDVRARSHRRRIRPRSGAGRDGRHRRRTGRGASPARRPGDAGSASSNSSTSPGRTA